MDDAGELGHWRVVAAAGSGRPLARRPRRAPPIDGLGGIASPYGTLKQWVLCEHNGPLGGKVTVGVKCDADMTGRGDVRHGGNTAGFDKWMWGKHQLCIGMNTMTELRRTLLCAFFEVVN
jgi:hypothetical protein